MSRADIKGNRAKKTFSIPELKTLLGGIMPRQFFAEYWQKKPLLIRQAVPNLDQVLDRQGLFDLACQEDAESRLVRPVRGNWQRQEGPFELDELTRLPKHNWSLLVSGVNMLIPEADDLLNAFNFAPYARLDDLMVSFAPPGGGVGPHFDSYDVFLIQGLGRRRWEISSQDDLELVDDCPLRILKHFRVDQFWELEPGDMLYLPPKYAHNGVALTDCMTWSIGFRSPSAQEMASEFLNYLQDSLCLDGLYADPDLGYSKQPGKIPPLMVDRLKDMIRTIRWTDHDMEDFIGRYLSDPKPNVFFEPPPRPVSFFRFHNQACKRGLVLNGRSRLLYLGGVFFMNGERLEVERGIQAKLRPLADSRRLPPGEFDDVFSSLLYEWYKTGFLAPAS